MKSRDKVYSFGLNLISDDLGPKSSFNFSPYFGLKKKIGNSMTVDVIETLLIECLKNINMI